MNSIKVLLLTAGDSSRLWPLRDKNFINFFDYPLVYYTLSQLKRFSLTNIFAVVNSENKKKFSEINSQFPDLTINLIEQKNLQGMAGAVIAAGKYIKGEKLLIISPTDITEDLLFSDFFKYLTLNPDGIIAGTSVSDYYPGGYLKVIGGNITDIIEKPEVDKVPSNLVYFVFNYFRNADFLLSALNKTRSSKDDLYEIAIKQLINNNFKFKFMQYKGYWGYLKYPWHVLYLNEFFLSKIKRNISSTASVHKSVVIAGEVWIEDNVRIMENVKIIGSTYIGKGTIVGNNSLVRQSKIGSNCVIGNGCEITRSHIGNSCWFHDNFVGDSVIDNNVSMGAGAICANFRLDESNVKSVINGKKLDTGKLKLGAIIGENSRIGVNASIMPGVKIGRNSIVGSGTVLTEDLPDNKFISINAKYFSQVDNKVKLNSDNRTLAINNIKK